MQREKGLGTVFWALVFIVVGVLLLLSNFGYGVPVWETLALYWPVLIIAWGVVKIGDYFRFKHRGRALFSAGEVALLVLFILFGAAFTAGAYLTSELSAIGVTLGEDFDLFDILGENHEFSDRLEAAIGAASEIEVRNAYGSVEVTGAETERIEVDIEKTVRASTREEAERLAPLLQFTITERDGVLVVNSNRDALDGATRRRLTSSLRLQVPRGSSLMVHNRRGRVGLANLSGSQRVDNQYGASSVRSLEGSVRIVSVSGAVSVEDVSGEVFVSNRNGPVAVSGVDGDVTVENLQGAVRISDVSGRTGVMNRYGSVSVDNARGGVRIEGRNNSINLERVSGGVEAETEYRDVRVRDAIGPIEIVNRHGDTRLLLVAPPQDDISVTGEYSDVRLELPSDSSFSMDAQIRAGTFESEFEGMDVLPSGRNLHVTGQHGTEGPRVTILAERGSVRVVR